MKQYDARYPDMCPGCDTSGMAMSVQYDHSNPANMPNMKPKTIRGNAMAKDPRSHPMMQTPGDKSGY